MYKVKVIWQENLKERTLRGEVFNLPKIGFDFTVKYKTKNNIEIEFGKIIDLHKIHPGLYLLRTTEGVYEVFLDSSEEEGYMADVVSFNSQKKKYYASKVNNLINVIKKFKALEKTQYKKEIEKQRVKTIKLIQSNRLQKG